MQIDDVMRAIRGLSLGVWLGAGVMTFITAHYVFGLEPDRNKAGDIMGAILHTGGQLKIALALLATLAQLQLRKQWPAFSEKLGALTLIVSLILAVTLVFYLEPKMVGLRAQIGTFNEANKDLPERVLFGKLHGTSMGLTLLETILVAIALVCSLI